MKRLDLILIEDISIRCIIGIYPRERVKKQPVKISIALQADLGKACRSDRIEDTVDYKAIKKGIIRMAKASRFMLVERLAGEIASICLANRKVRRVTVRVEKPGALRYARTVAVEICRNAGGKNRES